jgi:hypothetical protein
MPWSFGAANGSSPSWNISRSKAASVGGLFHFELALVTATENSTRPVTARITHAGIAIVDHFNLRLP